MASAKNLSIDVIYLKNIFPKNFMSLGFVTLHGFKLCPLSGVPPNRRR
jgi:hypothetical protein